MSTIRKPTKVGHFSRDGQGNYKEDECSKKYLAISDSEIENYRSLDLRFQPKKYIRFNEEKGLKPRILMWIKNNPQEAWNVREKRLMEDFIMDGRTLKEILKASHNTYTQIFKVYTFQESYIVWSVNKFKMDQLKADRCGFAGNKFELLITSRTNGGVPKPVKKVNENLQYYHINRTNLDKYKILYCSNIDCVEQVGDNEEIVELSVCRRPQDIPKDGFLREKLRDFFFKAYLSGAKKTICGFRTDYFKVDKIHVFQTEEIPKMCENFWKMKDCCELAKEFFKTVKSEATEDSKYYTVTVENDDGSQSKCRKVIKCVLSEETSDSEFFIPKWLNESFFSANSDDVYI